MIYPIVLYGDPVLKKEGEDLEPDDIDVKTDINAMTREIQLTIKDLTTHP